MMKFDKLIDFLILYRLWFVALTIIALMAFAYWLAFRLLRHSGYAPELWENSVRTKISSLVDWSNYTTYSSGAGDAAKAIIWIIAVIAVFIERAKALGKIGGLIGLTVTLIIVGGLWWFDRHEKLIVTAGLNFPDSQCKREHRDGTVIFIHGWTGDALATWKSYPKLMCGDTRYASYEVVSLGYPTLMRSRGLTISQIAEWIHESLRDRLKISNRDKIIFVAHSMGGLVAREITMLHTLSKSPGSITILVEIGTPHNGARVAPLASALGLSKDMINDMLESSNTLKSLHVHWNQLAQKPETLCYSSPQDNVVSESSAFFQCDYQFSFPLWSHTEMVKPESRKDERYRMPTQEIAKRMHLPMN